jgi:hypothetical protein
MYAVLQWLPYAAISVAAIGVTLVTAPWSFIHHHRKEHRK